MSDLSLTLQPIGRIHTPYQEKFSGLLRIEFSEVAAQIAMSKIKESQLPIFYRESLATRFPSCVTNKNA